MKNWQPLMPAHFPPELNKRTDLDKPNSVWLNDIYQVNVYEKPDIIWLSIKRIDKEPCNDWRDFQFIKNQLVGEECEAIQIYPAESRLVDGSNQYHLWCFKDPSFRVPVGFNDGRVISEHPLPGGKQRAWPPNMRPKDMDEQNEKTNKMLKEENLI